MAKKKRYSREKCRKCGRMVSKQNIRRHEKICSGKSRRRPSTGRSAKKVSRKPEVVIAYCPRCGLHIDAVSIAG